MRPTFERLGNCDVPRDRGAWVHTGAIRIAVELKVGRRNKSGDQTGVRLAIDFAEYGDLPLLDRGYRPTFCREDGPVANSRQANQAWLGR